MGVAHLDRDLAGDEVVEVLVAQHGDLGVEQGHVDILAFAGRLGMAQGRLNGDDRVKAGEDVGHRDADLLGLAAGLAGDRHQPADPLYDEVVAGARRIGAVLPEAGDGTIDEAGIDCLQAVVVEAVFLQPPELEVLDHHIGGRNELAYRTGALGRREIERYRPLAAIGRVVIGSRQVLAVTAHDEGRPPFARIVAAFGVLHLDHVRAEVGQQLARPRAGQDTRQFDHADAAQRWLRHCV